MITLEPNLANILSIDGVYFLIYTTSEEGL